jgi:AcrR family transcriptional regulator
MARSSDARQKALATAERLFRSQGFAATGLAQVIAESGSPKGSFYFHFPGGKDQLAVEALHAFAARGLQLIAHSSALSPGDATGFVGRLCAAFAAEMRESGYNAGCLLQNLATERAPGDPVLAPLLAEALTGWIEAIAAHFTACALPHPRRKAMALLAALEGGRTLARILRSDAPFEAIAAEWARS